MDEFRKVKPTTSAANVTPPPFRKQTNKSSNTGISCCEWKKSNRTTCCFVRSANWKLYIQITKPPPPDAVRLITHSIGVITAVVWVELSFSVFGITVVYVSWLNEWIFFFITPFIMLEKKKEIKIIGKNIFNNSVFFFLIIFSNKNNYFWVFLLNSSSNSE